MFDKELVVGGRRMICVVAALLAVTGMASLQAEVRMPALFGDHMVLQRGQPNPVWGWAAPGETVTVKIGRQSHSALADRSGKWRITLDPMEVGAPLELNISGENTVTIQDVLIGEVWLCSGQSNMEWPVSRAKDADLEIRTAQYPKIRLITVPRMGTQEPRPDFEGNWERCSPRTVGEFSAVGYYFGRTLHQTLGVPIGLIDNSWGGSAAEAWVRRDLLKADARYQPLLEQWAEIEKSYNHEQALAEYEKEFARWSRQEQHARRRGLEPPAAPRTPRDPLTGNHRPANLYNGVLHPIIGYGVRGVIWYQGESNASRADQYRHLFPLLIRSWREEWGQGDFPFYWVQLADFREERPDAAESDWAELREAQTRAMQQLPNTGEAVIIDLGEAHDIHPTNKQDVANRLVRWALARDYGLEIAHRSPLYRSMENKGGKIVITFDHVGGGLETFDVRDPLGFVIAGRDRKFVPAQGRIIATDAIEVWSAEVPDPVAVRYAWADNPVANLQTKEELRVTPFRTDDWPGITTDHHK